MNRQLKKFCINAGRLVAVVFEIIALENLTLPEPIPYAEFSRFAVTAVPPVVSAETGKGVMLPLAAGLLTGFIRRTRREELVA